MALGFFHSFKSSLIYWSFTITTETKHLKVKNPSSKLIYGGYSSSLSCHWKYLQIEKKLYKYCLNMAFPVGANSLNFCFLLCWKGHWFWSTWWLEVIEVYLFPMCGSKGKKTENVIAVSRLLHSTLTWMTSSVKRSFGTRLKGVRGIG